MTVIDKIILTLQTGVIIVYKELLDYSCILDTRGSIKPGRFGENVSATRYFVKDWEWKQMT